MTGSTRFELLIGAAAFWTRAAADIAAARRRVLVQAMTFEGDSAGGSVAAAIGASTAVRRSVLVDDYSRWVISDRHIWSPSTVLDRAGRAEVRATRAMFAKLVALGVGVRVTNPVGALFAHYPARNHKKLVVADDAAYIGGVNFSDHNFAWPDFMVRLEGREAADALAGDFEATYVGEPRAWRRDLGNVQLHSLDGRSNRSGFRDIFALIDGAQREITVVSPYLTAPFSDALAAACRRGVRVRLITPGDSNKPMVRNALLATASRSGFDVWLTPEMTHLKGMLVDDERLIVGSTNFDFVSLAAEEELVAIISDATLIEAFRTGIIAPALARGRPGGERPVSTFAGRVSQVGLRIAAAYANLSRTAPRGARDWPG